KKVAWAHSMSCFRYFPVDISYIFNITTLKRPYDRGNAVSVLCNRKCQGINPSIAKEQIQGQLSLTHEPLWLIHDDAKSGFYLPKIKQIQLPADRHVEWSTNVLHHFIVLDDSRQSRAGIPTGALIRPQNRTNSFGTISD